MNVSVNWLGEYMPITLPANELAEKISRTAVEVEEQFQPQGKMKNIVLAKVMEVVPHPDSDHLFITQIDAGEDELLQIVTGAQNVAVGQWVILAKHNSIIGDGTKIRKGKLRGVPSNGMLTALQEIGIADKVSPKDFEDGIWVFNEADAADFVPGANALEVLGLDDDLLELGITPNRADMLSMNGVAYEVAAILDETPTLPEFTLTEAGASAETVIAATAPAELAPKYAVRVIKDVTVGDSPLWLQRRLWNMGIRPISNVVDITNLMLLTYGQPLHAFDLNNLPAPELHVREAVAGEKITTLDGVEREAAAGDLVIASGDEALMFAGVMGGQSTEVTGTTTDVVLEAAVFDPKLIRRAAKVQNLHSEAAQRFERGVNVEATFTALDHAAAMIAEVAGGTVLADRVVAQDAPYVAPEVAVSVDQINHMLGTTITEAEVAAIFTRLQFDFTVAAGEFVVTVPARRWDITIPADLIEEVARMFGYDNLPATLPTGTTTPGALSPKQKTLRATRHALEGMGLNQAISYVLTTPEKANQFRLDALTPIELDYPMSQDRRMTRGSLVTSLLDDVAYNLARSQADVALYEQGRVFGMTEAGAPSETEHVAGVMTGNVQDGNWNHKAQAVDFFYLKGIVERLLADYKLADAVSFVATADHAEMHPGQTANILIGDQVVGFIGQIHPVTAKAYKITPTFAFELDLDQIMATAQQKNSYEKISRFPSMSRDLAILVDRDIASADLVATMQQAGGAHLKNITVFDVYTGANVADDKQSIAYSLTFVNPEQTLQEDEVTASVEVITTALAESYNASIR